MSRVILSCEGVSYIINIVYTHVLCRVYKFVAVFCLLFVRKIADKLLIFCEKRVILYLALGDDEC